VRELSIRRALTDETRKQGILLIGEVYSLHITQQHEVIITDNSDYTKIYNANKGTIGKNPNLIYPGQVFTIP